MSPRVSVVIPIRNGAATIAAAIRSLAAQTFADFEVILVDDASTDDGLERARAAAALLGERLVLVTGPGRGPAAARNAGLAAARGEVIAFMDADVEAESAWLEVGVAALADQFSGVEGRTLTPGGGPVPSGAHAMYNPEGGLFMTCNMFYRREVVAAAGGFDERYRRAFYEDSDLAFSVMARGGQIVFAPDAVIRHALVPAGRWALLREQRRFAYAPLLHQRHPALYARFIAPHLRALNPVHLDFLMAVLVFLVAVAARSLPAAVATGLLAARFFLRVRRLHRAPWGDPMALLQALLAPMVRLAAVLAGAVRFGHFSTRL